MSVRSRLIAVGLAVLALAPVTILAADDLTSLVPTDAALMLELKDFRERSKEIGASPLLARLRELPAVRDWEKSDRSDGFRKLRSELETTFGIGLNRLRDDVFGDSVVLAGMAPRASSGESEPSGLLLTRFRDRTAIDTVLKSLNDAEKAGGTLRELREIKGRDGSPTIWHRQFAPNTKPDEWYTILPGDIFAWSNSETALRDTIGRMAKRDGLGASSRFHALMKPLPEKAVVRFYAVPRLLIPAAPEGAPAPDAVVVAAIRAVEAVSAAIEWRDGPVLHLCESLDPENLPARLRSRPSTSTDAPLNPLRFVPRTAIIAATWRWDLASWYDAILEQVPEADRPRAEALATAAQGMLLGMDLRRDVLPALSPGGFAYVDLPESKGAPTFAASIDVANRRDVAQAIESGLKTVSALTALDEKRPGGPITINSSPVGDYTVTNVAGQTHSAAFGVSSRRVVLASTPAIVGGLLARDRAPEGGESSPISRLREEFFPRSQTFVAMDLARLHGHATATRATLIKQVAARRKGNDEDAARDLDRALALLKPFGGAFASWELSQDGKMAHQTLGLVGRRESSK